MSRTSKREGKPAKPPRAEKGTSRDDAPTTLTHPAIKRRPVFLLLMVSVSIAWFSFLVYVALYR